MVEIGRQSKLEVVKEVDFGVFLNGDAHGEILLPKRYVPKDCCTGQMIEVFIYLDSEDRIIATTKTPFAEVGQFAFLKVVSVTPIGAFLDWGLEKDLFVPFSEQREKMKEDGFYVVFLYLDSRTERIVASSKISKFLNPGDEVFKERQEVDLLIWEKTHLGYKSIINGVQEGLIFEEDIFNPLQIGQKITGYIQKIREDGKITLCLQPPGYKKIEALSDQILNLLKEKDGFIPVSDKSPPNVIYELFGISKKNYKKAIGSLYKKKLIRIESDGIHTTESPSEKKN